MKKKAAVTIIAMILLVAFATLFAGCTENNQQGTRATEMLDEQSTPVLTQSNERTIFMGYLNQVNDPNNIQWIYCFSWDGHLIFKSAVMGKTISATKSSDPYERIAPYDGAWNDYQQGRSLPGAIPGTTQLMNPSGMYGHDTPGVIWMDPQGNYYEWHEGPYFISNVPIKFETPVISYQNIDIDVYNHAIQIEEKLRNKENLTEEDKAWLNR